MKTNKVVIGLWPLSGEFGALPLSQIETTIKAAVDAGFRSFDTAPNYGSGFSESALGIVLAGEHGITVNTKCGNHSFTGKDFTPAALEKSFEQSRKRLRGLPIDVLFLHNPRKEIADYAPVIALLDSFKSKGLIGRSGLSAAKDWPYSEVAPEAIDALQIDVNLLWLKDLRRLGGRFSTLFARSVLATGILSGRLTNDATFPADDNRAGWLKGDRLRSLVKRVDAIKALIGAEPVSSVARRFALFDDAIDEVILGVKDANHITQISNDLARGPLPAALVQQLVALHDADFNLVGEAQWGY